MIKALTAAILLSTAVILLAVGSLKAGATWVFTIGLLFSAGLSIIPVLILRYLDRRERESPWLFAVSILWGALIATGLALPVNTGIIMAIGEWLRLYPKISEYLGPHGMLLLGAPLAASVVEELIKALGVLLLLAFLRAEFDNMRDGFVYGALVGVGFNLVEAPLYVAQTYAEHGVAPWGFSLERASRFSAWVATPCLPESLALFSAMRGKQRAAECVLSRHSLASRLPFLPTLLTTAWG